MFLPAISPRKSGLNLAILKMTIPVPTPASGETPLETVLEALFHTNRSKSAARLFLGRFSSADGRMNEDEMAKFVKELRSGDLGVTLSKADFYGRVLKTFLKHGLIRVDEGYDDVRRKSIPTYYVVWQKAPKRAPSYPSLAFNAHMLGLAWDHIFSDAAYAGS
jgi:hypothetical protein